jgi:hypothetical protein
MPNLEFLPKLNKLEPNPLKTEKQAAPTVKEKPESKVTKVPKKNKKRRRADKAFEKVIKDLLVPKY